MKASMRRRPQKTDAAILRSAQCGVFALCWGAYFLTYFGRLNLSVAMNAMETEFSSGKAGVGLLGSVFFWVYAVGKLINGYRGDASNNKHVVFIALICTGICNLGISFAHEFWIVLVLWAINGYAQSAMWCNIICLVANWFYPRQHANIAVWLSTSMVGGAFFGLGGCGLLMRFASWRFVFLLPGVLTLAFAFLWLFCIQNTAADKGFADVKTKLTPVGGNAPQSKLWPFLCTSGLGLIIIASLAQGVIKDGIGLWGPSMLQDAYSLDAADASFLLLFIPVMNFFGISLTGFMQKKLRLQDATCAITLMAMGAFCLVGLRLFMGQSVINGVFWLSLVSAVMYGVNTVLLSVFPLRFAAAGRVSFVSGLLDFCSYIAAGLSTLFAGAVLDKGLGWNAVFAVWLILTAVGIGALLLIRRKSRVKT